MLTAKEHMGLREESELEKQVVVRMPVRGKRWTGRQPTQGPQIHLIVFKGVKCFSFKKIFLRNCCGLACKVTSSIP